MSSNYREPARPFACKLCDKSFVKRYELSNHQRVHTNERPYQCQNCNRNFRWRSSVKYHKSQACRPGNDTARGSGSGSKPTSSSRSTSARSTSGKKASTAPQRKPFSAPEKKRHNSHHHHAGSSSVRQGTGTDGVLLFNLDGMAPFSDPLSV